MTPSVQSPAFGGRGSGRPPGQSHDHDLEGEGPLPPVPREGCGPADPRRSWGQRRKRLARRETVRCHPAAPDPTATGWLPKGVGPGGSSCSFPRPGSPGRDAEISAGRRPGAAGGGPEARVLGLTQAAPSQTGQDPTEPFHTHYTLGL